MGEIMCNKGNIIKKYNLNVIPMASFLYNFCAICDHNVFKVTHYDIKRLFPYLKTCSIEYVCKNYDLVCDGSVILVKDAKNNILPYYNPLRSDKSYDFGLFDDIEELDYYEGEEEKEVDLPNFDDLDNMSFYELIEAYRLYRDSKTHGKYKACRMLHEEFSARKISRVRRKERIIEERRKENEKY